MARPAVGSLWQYTGRNPDIVGIGGTPARPDLEVIEVSTDYLSNSIIRLKILGTGNNREIVYRYDTFQRYFVPKGDQSRACLTRFTAILAELGSAVQINELHDLLVKLEI